MKYERSARVLGFVVPFALTNISAAFAQTADEPENVAMARVLYSKALEDLDAQRYPEACQKLEKVVEWLPKGIGAHEMLGECYEKLDRLATALDQYTIAQTLACAGDNKIRCDGLRVRMQRVESRVAHVSLTFPSPLREIEGLSVSYDHRLVDKQHWDARVPADRGKHLVEVRADGYKPWTREIDVEKNGQSYWIQLPYHLEKPNSIRPQPQTLQEPPRRHWLGPTGWTLTSLGLASGATFGVLTAMAYHQADLAHSSGHCNEENRCDAEGVRMIDQGRALMPIANAAAIAGGVLGVAGITMLIVGRKKEGTVPKQTTGSTLMLDVSPQGVGLHGAW